MKADGRLRVSGPLGRNQQGTHAKWRMRELRKRGTPVPYIKYVFMSTYFDNQTYSLRHEVDGRWFQLLFEGYTNDSYRVDKQPGQYKTEYPEAVELTRVWIRRTRRGPTTHEINVASQDEAVLPPITEVD